MFVLVGVVPTRAGGDTSSLVENEVSCAGDASIGVGTGGTCWVTIIADTIHDELVASASRNTGLLVLEVGGDA